MNTNYSITLAGFAAQTGYDDLPAAVVNETKRILLDIVGCAIGSTALAKGRLSIQFARATGGPPEASILGASGKVGIGAAAFANGELMHSMDFCALLPPGHVSPFVTAAPLAVAEAKHASGQTLILAVALAHEIASRVGVSLDAMRAHGATMAKVWGLGFNAFGAAAGVAKILGLDSVAMNDAFGLAGYYAPVPSHNKSLYTTAGGGLAKYGPAGWTAQAGVTTAVLASMGYEGDRSVLDGDSGFWAMTASKGCNFEKMVAGLGSDWYLMRTLYKRYPTCGIFHSPLGAFSALIDEHALNPEEIESIVILNEGQGRMPRFHTGIANHVDTQNSLEFNIAVAAHRIPPGPRWQCDEVMGHPGVRALMRKVTVEPYTRAEEARQHELNVEGRPYIDKRPCLVRVRSRGRDFVKEADYAYWLSHGNPAYRATDENLAAKFRANASETLGAQKTERAIDTIMNLDKLASVADLTADLVL